MFFNKQLLKTAKKQWFLGNLGLQEVLSID